MNFIMEIKSEACLFKAWIFYKIYKFINSNKANKKSNSKALNAILHSNLFLSKAQFNIIEQYISIKILKIFFS